jgi:hypothetical protein
MWVHVIDQNICSEVLGKTKVFYCLRPVYQQSVLLPEVCVPNILRYWERPKCSIAWGLCTKHSEVLGKTKVFYCLRPVYQTFWGTGKDQSVLLPEACVPNILRYWERPKCSIACVPTKCSIAWGLCTKQSVLLPEACVPNKVFYCPRPVYHTKCSNAWGLCTKQSVLLPEACVPTKCSNAWGLCTKQSVLLPEACVPNKVFYCLRPVYQTILGQTFFIYTKKQFLFTLVH